jgi:hypothetical protein
MLLEEKSWASKIEHATFSMMLPLRNQPFRGLPEATGGASYI